MFNYKRPKIYRIIKKPTVVGDKYVVEKDVGWFFSKWVRVTEHSTLSDAENTINFIKYMDKPQEIIKYYE